MAGTFHDNQGVFVAKTLVACHDSGFEGADVRVGYEARGETGIDGNGAHVRGMVGESKGLMDEHGVFVDVFAVILDIPLADGLEIAKVVALASKKLNQAANDARLAAVLAGSAYVEWFHGDTLATEQFAGKPKVLHRGGVLRAVVVFLAK